MYEYVVVGVYSWLLFSLFVGHFFTKPVVSEMHKTLGESWAKERQSFAWHPSVIGYIERTLYTTAWNLGKPEFIAVWLALKVAGQWKTWTEYVIVNEEKYKVVLYIIFPVGNGLSILYALTGSMIIKWLEDHSWTTLAAPLALMVASLALLGFIRSQELQRRK